MDETHNFVQSLLPHSNLSFRMLRIPGGEFQMGSPKGEPDAYEWEQPQHTVELHSFYLAEYAVTQELWAAVMASAPSHFKGGQRPVECVSWFDAVVFCNALSQMTGKDPVYLHAEGHLFGWDGKAWTLPNEGKVHRNPQADGYCLPTEAQWEYAARDTQSESLKYAGSDVLDQVGWYQQNSEFETHNIGLLLPNTLGLYDMSGNVFEWCEDWYRGYNSARQKNHTGPETGVRRVLRGGYWGGGPRDCRSTYRNYNDPDYRATGCGFRLSLQSVG